MSRSLFAVLGSKALFPSSDEGLKRRDFRQPDFSPAFASFSDFGSSESLTASLRSYQNRPSFERSFLKPVFPKVGISELGDWKPRNFEIIRNVDPVIIRDLDESEEFVPSSFCTVLFLAFTRLSA